jgi:hypothetical protein
MVMLNSSILVFIQRVVPKEQHLALISLLRQSMVLVQEHLPLMLLILKINQLVICIGSKRKNLAHIWKESNLQL